MELKNKVINFLGDSITEGVGADSPEKNYVNLIASRTGAMCNNYGISGTRIAIQSKPSEEPSFDLDFCSRVADMTPDAEIVLVFGGTNDYGHGDAPLGELSDKTPDTFCGALHTLYASLKEKYSHARIVVLIPLHRLGEDNVLGDGAKEKAAEPLSVYVEKIRKIAATYELPMLDLYDDPDLRLDLAHIAQRLTTDGLHPNNEGYAMLADKIIHFLEEME